MSNEFKYIKVDGELREIGKTLSIQKGNSEYNLKISAFSDKLIITDNSDSSGNRVFRFVFYGSFDSTNGIVDGTFSSAVVADYYTSTAMTYEVLSYVIFPLARWNSLQELAEREKDLPYSEKTKGLMDRDDTIAVYTYISGISISPSAFKANPRTKDAELITDESKLKGLKGAEYFPDGWEKDPFNPKLDSLGSPTTNPSSSTTLATTVAIDTLTGTANTKDTFTFSATPAFGKDKADHITNFVSKRKLRDTLAISKSAYGLSAGKVTLKAISTDKALTKAFASTSLFVYDKRDGGLYLNADGKTAGFGATGGLFAILDNQAGLTAKNILLI